MSADSASGSSPSRPRTSLSPFHSFSFGSPSRPSISNPSMLTPPHLIIDGPPAKGASSGKSNFCAHPIKTTGSTFRKLMRRASLSLRPGHDKESAVLTCGHKRWKGKGPMGDAESGIVLDETDTDDSFYAADAVISPGLDFVKHLPAEITAHIMSYLDHKSLLKCEAVSPDWHEAAINRHVWRNVFRNEYGPWESYPGRDWKRMFTVRKELDIRWKKAEVDLTYLKGHTDSVYCVQFDNSKIITGSRDKTIRVWDMKGNCQRILGPDASSSVPPVSAGVDGTAVRRDYHSASVLCLQFDDEIMVSGSSDHTCIVWSLPSYTSIGKLQGHTAGVLDVCFDKDHIVSCSKDTSICIWDRTRPGRLIRSINGHRGPVNAVAIRGNLVVSASGDALIKLWDIKTGKCVREFKGHHRGLACVQFSEDARTIVSGGNDQDIRVWDAHTGECLQVLSGHKMLVRTLHLDSKNRRIISGSYDQSVKVWNLETGKMILDIKQFHSTWILSAKADYKRIISTSQDSKCLMLDFGKGVEGLEVLDS